MTYHRGKATEYGRLLTEFDVFTGDYIAMLRNDDGRRGMDARDIDEESAVKKVLEGAKELRQKGEW